jgi:serine/threonine protein kinase
LKTAFEEEHAMLLAFAGNPKTPLINLCGAFTWKGDHYFITSSADANLEEYWTQVKLPEFNSKSIIWMLQQCKQLAYALHCMHDYRNREHYQAADPSQLERDPQSGHEPQEANNWIYVRHGDIKPDKIVWVSPPPGEDTKGRLILADFGRSTFHKAGLESYIENTPFRSSTYEPPDVELKITTSLRYDIWSLGCVYLDFITWMSLGFEGILDFSHRRLTSHPKLCQIRTDQFYMLKDPNNMQVKEYILKPSVDTWVSKLRKEYRFCPALGDFLDLILEHMLRIQETDRLRPHELLKKLSGIHDKALIDDAYTSAALSEGVTTDVLYGMALPNDTYLFDEAKLKGEGHRLISFLSETQSLPHPSK